MASVVGQASCFERSALSAVIGGAVIEGIDGAKRRGRNGQKVCLYREGERRRAASKAVE
jgi:hypothetical protein